MLKLVGLSTLLPFYSLTYRIRNYLGHTHSIWQIHPRGACQKIRYYHQSILEEDFKTDHLNWSDQE